MVNRRHEEGMHLSSEAFHSLRTFVRLLTPKSCSFLRCATKLFDLLNEEAWSRLIFLGIKFRDVLMPRNNIGGKTLSRRLE